MQIQVEHLTYIYDKGQKPEHRALDDVSFSIASGSFTGLIGHTGSGKSTLVQHLNALRKPSAGRIRVGDLEITATGTNLREVRKHVGLVFQYPEYQLFEETVARDVAFGPRNLGVPEDEIEELVQNALRRVGLHDGSIAARSPFALSGGQRRRAAIAGVIAMNPDVLILDEPAAGLDPQAHREIMEMIDDIHRENHCTVLLVSHNMDDVAAYCDQVLVMDQGRLIMDGTPKEIFSHDEELKAIGLGLPSCLELIYEMKKRGADLRLDGQDHRTDPEEEAIGALVRYYRNRTGREEARAPEDPEPGKDFGDPEDGDGRGAAW